MAPAYDFIIAGGGCAGLSLLYQLLHSPLSQSSILVVDRSVKSENDRTWSFWARQPTPFESLVSHRWPQIALHAPHESLRLPLAPYEYRSIHSRDLYRYMQRLIKDNPQVDMRIGEVTHLESDEREARLVCNGHTYRAQWIFNSLLDKALINEVQQASNTILQHFLGWRIKSPTPSFDPQCVTLFDFRVAQEGATRFVYILPYSNREALVEYTLFSAHPLDYEHYAQPLRAYLRDTLALKRYSILEEEQGVIPMSDYSFLRRSSTRVMNIGTRGGMVKPSTGYAFQRIQEDSIQICQALVTHGSPFAIRRAPRRYFTFDAMMLDIFRRSPALAPAILYRLFARNRVDQIFEFLNERAGVAANIPIMWRMPWRPFLQAYWHVKHGRR